METKRIRYYGIVQGVGFRPTVTRHAQAAGICGSVCNRGSYVEVYAQGSSAQIEQFLRYLQEDPPPRAVIAKRDVIPAENQELYTEFSIIESKKESGMIFISPDIATCSVCQKELYDPKNRRYLHPFINCTCCGPRLTILESLPYDRERTSMKAFPMCDACRQEYYGPESRRFDAQPVCCNDCGPEVYLLGRAERGADAIRVVREILRRGGIAAIKGIGGFHLCCDAMSDTAVAELRQRKRRPAKPFAVMMRNEDAVQHMCELTEAQKEVLTGHQKPIVLLRRREAGELSQLVAPGNPKIGVMLPYAPIHFLLFDYRDGTPMPDALVMTSGNASGAPICRDDQEAQQELAGFCDVILTHNREIRTRADDTVMDFYRDEPYMIRRSRGYAPLPNLLSHPFSGQLLAVGGELKNTFCVGKDSLFYPSAYVGDLEDVRTVDALSETMERMTSMLEVSPSVMVCDLHPGYHSTEVAQEYGLPLVQIQHHYAHIVSCMAENDWEEKVLGVSFDGTGYGPDGSIWGGEILEADLHGYKRLASIAPFPQSGGDTASKEGWRVAVNLAYMLCGDRERVQQDMETLGVCPAERAGIIMTMADRGLNTVRSSSAGRLFDAVSAVTGICRASTFEGEAACALQYAAEAWAERHADQDWSEMWMDEWDPRPRQEEGRWILPTDSLFAVVLRRCLDGGDPGETAWYFHRGLAECVAHAVQVLSEEREIQTVALSGGVYQNTLLLQMTEQRLAAFHVLRHSLIPPNDGGIALGQAVAGMQYIEDQRQKGEI